MKFDLIRVKNNGVVVPRHLVGLLRIVRGRLVVQEERMPELNRSARVASFFATDPSPLKLVDATLVHASSERLVLTGFEQVMVDGRLTDFSQTWVLNECEGEVPEAMRGPPFPG